jgi:D-alanyl-D-alanine dipeptidase
MKLMPGPRKRIWRRLTLVAIALVVAVTLVTTSEISYQQLSRSTQALNPCPNTSTSQCLNPKPASPPPPFIPDQKLSEQQRFLSTVVHKLGAIPPSGTFEHILLRAYGAVFVNQEPEVQLPPKVIFTDDQDTQKFQSTLTLELVNGTHDCYLQKPAAEALNKAITLEKISLKSGHGPGDCTRSFATNLKFWQKYANNRTLARVKQGKETRILGLVAPPGTSQHLWGLAVDLQVFNQEQRKALNQNGWFQTVEFDVPHWTYTGQTAENLPKFGLQSKVVRGITYWLTPV